MHRCANICTASLNCSLVVSIFLCMDTLGLVLVIYLLLGVGYHSGIRKKDPKRDILECFLHFTDLLHL